MGMSHLSWRTDTESHFKACPTIVLVVIVIVVVSVTAVVVVVVIVVSVTVVMVSLRTHPRLMNPPLPCTISSLLAVLLHRVTTASVSGSIDSCVDDC